jgi:hypothetical protein
MGKVKIGEILISVSEITEISVVDFLTSPNHFG